ncbi:helix-turn-helix transcriptional regulator [Thalassotalea euphylliae]|uniref:AlpA family phage regulatory protein n=1 Tax=Thalassotalea euphylliae TaxID=1655234 RepID=A0A3E0UD71_9GAMM|nr:AlpA family phage regulatory protein [Thalassotalea euphylliae]REL34045.1 AlpA family phage regulatory protein [Thalassotalea euphylliae]
MNNSIQLVRAEELRKLLGVSASTLWRMRQRKEIPAPIYLSARIIAWEKQVISEWIKERGHKYH